MSSDWEDAQPADEPRAGGGDRLPPHSEEAERGVLGCIFLSPVESLTECSVRLKAGPKAFYDLRYRTIYEVMLGLFNEEPPRPIDAITVAQDLRDLLVFDKVGGWDTLSSLPDAVPSAANLSYYLDIIIEKHVLRKLQTCCVTAIESINSNPGDVSALMTQVEKDLTSIVSDAQNTETLHTATALLEHVDQAIAKFQNNPGILDGLATGLVDLDKITQGFRSPEVIVLAARPSTGKSAWGLNVAEHNAITLRIPVGFFSLEMSAESLAFRLALGRAKVSMGKAKAGVLDLSDIQKLSQAHHEITDAPLYIDDERGLSLMGLKAKARRMASLYGLKLIVIDYLQLISVPAARFQNRETEVRIISDGIGALAKELGIPIIVLSQLNREMERAGNRKPRMSDIRESGAVENNADIIIALWREKNKPEPEDGETQLFAEVIECSVLKNRNGPTGDCRLTFIRPWTKFQNLST